MLPVVRVRGPERGQVEGIPPRRGVQAAPGGVLQGPGGVHLLLLVGFTGPLHFIRGKDGLETLRLLLY